MSHPNKLLIVDDNALNRAELCMILLDQDYLITEAKDGRQAVRLMDQEQFDGVLLDIIMPELDGFAVLEWMRDRDMLSDIPVIVISALDDLGSAVSCIELGAEDYLSRPMEPVLLKARVSASLEKKRLRDNQHAAVSELKLERARLQQYAAELQASNEELDAFAHTVAHDLKTPLSVIMGCSELLLSQLDKLQPSEREECLKAIRQNGVKLNSITDELLLLATVRRRGQVKLEQLDMAMIVAESKARLDHEIDELGAVVSYPTSWPSCIGYSSWVEEVWVNYISNALKYGGDPPEVKLGASVVDDATVTYWVEDNGVGIALEDQSRLFTPFTRLETRQATGYGLGLSIVKRIVNKLGGQVGVESVPGQGSKFSFTLPVAPAAS